MTRISSDGRNEVGIDPTMLKGERRVRRPVRSSGRVFGAASLMFWWLAVGQQNGCMTSDSGPKAPSDKYVLSKPVIVVATPEKCLAEAELPTTSAEVCRVGNDPNRFRVVVPVADRDKPKQRGEMFCWAACTQTLLSQIGRTIDQQKVADEYRPNSANQSASVGVVIRALNPDLEQQVEAKGAVPIDVFPTTSDQMLDELMAGHLCIAGLVRESAGIGHACVVCGATFAKLKLSTARVTVQASGMGPHAEEAMRTAAKPAYGIYEVELIDPERGFHRKLTGRGFHDQAQFIIDQPFARDMLLAALKSDPRYSSHTLVVQDAHSSMKSTSSAGPGHTESHVECSSHS